MCLSFFANKRPSQINQDRYCLEYYAKLDTVIMGVFDGHGSLGHAAAEVCRTALPSGIVARMAQNVPVQDAILQGWDEVNKTLLSIAKSERGVFPLANGGLQNDMDYGTTAAVVVVRGRECWIAHAGDSRVLAVTASKTAPKRRERACQSKPPAFKLLFATDDHNPTVHEGERKRVGETRGRLQPCANELRLFPGDIPFEEARKRNLTLNMSRALGHLRLSEYGVTADPTISTMEIDPLSETYFVCVSDGVSGVRDKPLCVSISYRSSHSSLPPLFLLSRIHPTIGCEQ
jgi:serine/threonine protein phosphatase PrpC